MKVTKAHYAELQKRLKEQNPDRDLPEYDGGRHDVQSIKLDLLRSITPDNNEDRVDDDDDSEARKEEDGFEINSFFPFTLTFLDLSTLGLKEEVSKRLPLPLFLREEYDYISTLIRKRPQGDQGSVIVSGQPGTGEVLVSLSHRI